MGIEATTFSLRGDTRYITRLHSGPLTCRYALDARDVTTVSALHQLQPNCTASIAELLLSRVLDDWSGSRVAHPS